MKLTHGLFMTLLLTATAFPGSDEGRSPRRGRLDDRASALHRYQDPFEPTVTGEESALLKRVLDVAATNDTAAIAILREHTAGHASPALDFALANLLFQREELDAAGEAYRAALEKLPRYRNALSNLTRVYLLQDRSDAAIRLLQQLVRDGQADEDTLVLLGHVLVKDGRFVAAEGAYRHAMLLRPGDTESRLGLTRCLMEQKRYHEAVSLLEEVVREEAGRSDVWELRAGAHLALGQEDAALVAMETARRLDAASPSLLATLGDLYINRQQPQEAISAYEQAFDVDEPSLPRMLQAARGFILIDAPGRAEQMLVRASNAERALGSRRTEPSERLLRLRLQADLATLRGDLESARSSYGQLLSEEPLDGPALLALGDLHRQAGGLEEAVMMYERASRIEGFEASALVRTAQAEVQRERYGRAAELLERAQAFDDQPHVARYLQQVRRLARLSSHMP